VLVRQFDRWDLLLMPLLLLHGDNALEIDEAARSAREPFQEADTLTYDGSTVSLGQLSEACRTAGLFDPQRLVIVHRLHERLKGAKKEGDTEEIRLILLSLAPTTTLLLLSPDMAGDHPLVQYVREAGGRVRTFSLPRKSDLTGWIVERVKKHGGSIDRDAAELLGHLVGANAVALNMEVQKLTTYAGEGKRIAPPTIELLVGAVTQDSIFTLVDAVASGDRAQALSLLHRQIEESSGTPTDLALYLIRMLARQVRILLRIRLGQQAHRSQSQIVSDLKLPRYYAGRYFQQAKRLPQERLKGAFEQLAALEYGLKSGRVDPTTGLDLLIVDLCA